MSFADLRISVNLNGRAEQRVCCPQCSKGDWDRTLGANIATGVFHCFRCSWKGIAVDDEEGNAEVAHPIYHDDAVLAEKKRERLRRTWSATVSLRDPSALPIRRYLETRSLGSILDEPPECLRVHPGLAYWDGTRELGIFPAMVALFAGADGSPVTLHVTYVRFDGSGKAPVPSPKKILGVPVRGATRGGSIRLYEPIDGILGVAEGIESALSLHVLRKIPVWAAFCADNLARMRLPAGLRELHIGVDIDDSGKGQQVAVDLASTVQQRWTNPPHVFIDVPDGSGPRDLNDELRRAG